MVFVFDLGNVLIEWDRRHLYEQLIDDPDELDYFLDNVLTLEENAVLDRGTPLPVMAADLAARKPDYRELIEAFASRWIETIGTVYDDNVAVLRELTERGIACYALSNWGADTFALVEQRYDWFALFEAMVISGHVGVVKPDPEIFAILCQRHGFEPGDAVFIDDSAANIATADRLGFTTVHLTEPTTLRRELERRGLFGPSR